MIDYLRKCNPSLAIKSVYDNSFLKYGKILSEYNFAECLTIMGNREIPKEGNIYVASDDELMKTDLAKDLINTFYGNTAIEIGYCNGNSNKLNALEYHKCSEIDVAATDLVLILGDVRMINNNQFKSKDVEIFFVPKDTALELYSTTLHFAPCKVTESGFKSIIVLTQGTNQPLPSLPDAKCNEEQLLWMQNKWLIAHAESIPASKGAFIGIVGDNIEIKYM